MADKVPEALELLKQKIHEGAAIPFVHGIVPFDDDAIQWIRGLGLFVEVIASGGPYDGQRVRAKVSGDLYASFSGDFGSMPIGPSDHLLIALVEGSPQGQCLAIARVAVEASAPPDTIAGRGVHALNLRTHYMHKLRKGAGVFIETDAGDIHLKMGTKGSLVFRFPDGSAFDFSPPTDPVGLIPSDALAAANGDGWAMKFKQSGGACFIVSGRGIELKSPSGVAFIRIDDSGIQLWGPIVRTVGMTILDVRPGEPVLLRSVMFGGDGVPVTAGPSGVVLPTALSRGVFVGLGIP